MDKRMDNLRLSSSLPTFKKHLKSPHHVHVTVSRKTLTDHGYLSYHSSTSVSSRHHMALCKSYYY